MSTNEHHPTGYHQQVVINWFLLSTSTTSCHKLVIISQLSFEIINQISWYKNLAIPLEVGWVNNLTSGYPDMVCSYIVTIAILAAIIYLIRVRDQLHTINNYSPERKVFLHELVVRIQKTTRLLFAGSFSQLLSAFRCSLSHDVRIPHRMLSKNFIFFLS